MATQPRDEDTASDAPTPTALPSVGARIIAFASILIAGLAGGVIGYGFTDLQCSGDCTVQTGIGGLVGAVIGAVGTAVVVVLALRAMGEWQTVQESRAQAPPADGGAPRVK